MNKERTEATEGNRKKTAFSDTSLASCSAKQRWPTPRIVYHRQYNIGLLGLERLHPFDSRKYGRAWSLLRGWFGRELRQFRAKPARPLEREELLAVHSPQYLDQLADSKFIASVLEVPQVQHVPAMIVDRAVLRPMRWAAAGTVLAARLAMQHGIAINLSGGYHHASRDFGHGFSAYADVGLAIDDLRKTGTLAQSDRVVYVDLDAHHGNGVCRAFLDDSRVFIYDQYNSHIFPMDVRAQRRIDCDVRLPQGCAGAEYLARLHDKLPTFLNALQGSSPGVRLAIYNAGTDIYRDDRLGGLNVPADQVLQRDRFVISQLIARRIPLLILLSGGYSAESYQMVAEMAGYVLETWGRLTRRSRTE